LTESPTGSPRALSPAAARRGLGAFAVLDLREDAAFARGHLGGSGHVPFAELRARRAELPPRDRPLLLVADDPALAARAAGSLAESGHDQVFWLEASLAEIEGGLAETGPAARLWRPAPFLDEVLPAIARGRAADLAAGAGREAVFLAINGFDVEAWDSDAEALDRARALAARNGVTLRTVIADLEAEASPLPESAFDLVTCFRFLHRPILPMIALALAPGGTLVYETYRLGQERFGKPRRPRFLLEPGELTRAFAGLEILRYEEPSPPGGPWTARLLARRTRAASDPGSRP
jgi:SAM-dependent methyltransferase